MAREYRNHAAAGESLPTMFGLLTRRIKVARRSSTGQMMAAIKQSGLCRHANEACLFTLSSLCLSGNKSHKRPEPALGCVLQRINRPGVSIHPERRCLPLAATYMSADFITSRVEINGAGRIRGPIHLSYHSSVCWLWLFGRCHRDGAGASAVIDQAPLTVL